MSRISWTSDLVIGTKRPHNFVYYRRKFQKLNILSNTDLICNIQVEFHENRHTHTHTHRLSLPCQAKMIISNQLIIFENPVVYFHTILMDLGTIRIYKVVCDTISIPVTSVTRAGSISFRS